jgi:hypothetical protein
MQREDGSLFALHWAPALVGVPMSERGRERETERRGRVGGVW